MPNQLLVFAIEGQNYALRVSAVERVVRAVEVVPLPSAPEIVSGVIDAGGRVLPVVNLRRRFRLPEHDINPSDQMIIANTSRRTVVLVVDGTSGVVELADEAITPAGDILPDLEFVKGVVRLDGGLTLIQDLDAFLSLDEEEQLDDALKPAGVAAGVSRRERET